MKGHALQYKHAPGEFIYEQEGSNPDELALIQQEAGRVVKDEITDEIKK